MQSDNSIKTEIALYLNEIPVRFSKEDIELSRAKPTDIHFRIVLPDQYEARGIKILLGGDVGIAGFEISLLPTAAKDVFIADPSDIESICGMRLIGKTSLSIQYFGCELMGYFTYVVFESKVIVNNYVNLMREDLRDEEEAILDFYGLSREEFVFDSIEHDESCQPTLMKYLMLVHLYKSAKPILKMRLEELEGHLKASSTGSWQMIHRVSRLNIEQVTEAYRSGEAFFANALTTYPLPLKVPVKHSSTSFNVPANRYLGQVFKKIIKEIEKVLALLTEEIKDIEMLKANVRSLSSYKTYLDFKACRLQQAFELCIQFKNDCYRFLQNLSQLGVVFYKKPESRPIYLRMPYRVLADAYVKYSSHIRISQEAAFLLQPSCAVQTRSINYLYELWVTIHVFQILTKKLGFICEKQSLSNVEMPLLVKLFSKNGIELKNPKKKGILKFYYNKKFPYLTQPFCVDLLGVFPRAIGGSTKIISKNNPDICLEFYDGITQQPKILIFDPTFSNNPQIHKEKNYYSSLILFRENYNAPTQKWKKVVVESIAVHPHKLEEDLPLEGEWPLVPGESINNSVMYLEELLEMHGVL